MDYPALSKKMIDQFKGIGLDNNQMDKAHEKAKTRLDEKQGQLGLSVRDRIDGDRKVLRLLLLGKTGAGKSSTGNLILGKNCFEASVQTQSVTKTIAIGGTAIDGIKVMVVDTPGFLDTDAPPEQAITEMAKVLELYKDGIDGILFVYSMGNPRFTAEEQEAFQHLQQGIIGGNFINHCFVIITYGDKMVEHNCLEDFILCESQSPFGNLLTTTVDKRVIAVDNADDSEYGRQIQREQIIRMILTRTKESCKPDVLKHFLHSREEVAKTIDKQFYPLIPDIEERVLQQLSSMPYNKIKGITADEKLKINEDIAESLSKDPNTRQGDKGNTMREVINKVFTTIVDTLTRPEILQKVANFVIPLLKAAWGIVVKLILKK